MSLALLAGSAALAALPAGDVFPVPAGDFVVATGGATVSVSAVGVPRGIGILPEYRICRLNASWDATAHAVSLKRVGDCHPNLADEVDDAIPRWKIEIATPPPTDRGLFEVWYVFPELRGDPVRLFVRQAWNAGLTVRSAELGVLEWGLKGMVPLEYPPEAAMGDTELTTCDVRVEIAPSGTPGGLKVTGCDEVFVPTVLQGLDRWRFHTESLDGIPTWSAVTLAVKFTRSIEADGPVGTATVLFPPDPDLGDRTVARVDDLPPEREPRPNPTWPPRFIVDHLSFAKVAVYDWRFPDGVAPSAEERSCDVLFGVNQKRMLWAWTETCDPEVQQATEDAANLWILKPYHVVRGELYARFRATFVFPPDGAPVLVRIPSEDLSTPAAALPDRFETYARAQATRRVPPEIPRSFATEVLDEVVVCDLVANVSTQGSPREITVTSCPPSYTELALGAVRRWKWLPAEVDGKAIESRERVRVRFTLPGSLAKGPSTVAPTDPP